MHKNYKNSIEKLIFQMNQNVLIVSNEISVAEIFTQNLLKNFISYFKSKT
jgi:hypothetical protein